MADKNMVGVTLWTKDGQQTGNAIIYRIEDAKFPTEDGFVYLVETDFGNTMKMTREEITTQFNIGLPTRIDRWRLDRAALQAGVKK